MMWVPSRSSEVVALLRAGLARPRSAGGDADAQARLCHGMPPTRAVWLLPQLEARTRFFDGVVQDAISAGTTQVVVCGAGYDDRALRFRAPGVRFFELDHPATQRYKARRLRATGCDTTGLTLAPADFGVDDVAEVLAAAGHDDRRPTLFLCEGLLVYLEAPAITALLAGVARRAAAGSVLAASLSVHAAGVSTERVLTVANARRAHRAERWRTILPAPAHLELVERAGWSVEDVLDASRLATGLEPGRCLLVTAGLPPASRGCGGPR